jgi:hypothetical protein
MMKTYRWLSLSLMIAFVVVGLVFLCMPGKVLIFFNSLSGFLGLPLIPVHEAGFYHILAVGYMALVAVIAYFMHRYPEVHTFPLLLAHGKFASSALSLGFALVLAPHLIFLVNCTVDGFIGLVAFCFYRRLKGKNS